MTCGSCEAKVQSALLSIPQVTAAEVSKDHQSATISTKGAIAVSDLQSVLDPKYQITTGPIQTITEPSSSWLATYKPVLLIFLYLTVVTALVEVTADQPAGMRWMRHFMAGFFLTFSFFKMMYLKGFRDSYAMYDIVARKFPAWG